MKISLFGKELFSVTKAQGKHIYNTAHEKLEKSDYLIDFYKDTGNSRMLEDYVGISNDGLISHGKSPTDGKKGRGRPKKVAPKIELTPKGVHELKLLHDESYQIKADPKYVDEQIEEIKEKLNMIKTSEFDMNYGTTELASILSRLENRKKYTKHEAFYSEFPYTTTGKINDLVKAHDYLQLGTVAQFIADMPKDATEVIKQYTKETQALCGKKPLFYIIANKKDFQKSQSRRDPILLAQSPFAHAWQILGAWDEEMILVDEL